MEKLKIFVYSFILLLLGILTFTLTKSWLVYDRGIEVIPADEEKKKDLEEPKKETTIYEWEESSRIYWKKSLVFPVGLTTESGGLGPDNVMQHARNLIIVSLKTGKKKKLFNKDVYVWDFFQSEFSRKTSFSIGDEHKIESIEIPNGILIFAATYDTNEDGFLNHKDKKKVFLYDTNTERLIEVLPEDYFFEKIIWNAGRDRLALVIRKIEKVDDKIKFTVPYLFIYNYTTNKRMIIELSN